MATKIKVEQVTAGVMRVLALVAEQDATGVTKAPAATVRNPQYLPVKKCCASCRYRDIERAMRLRFCEVREEEVHPSFCCDRWKMSQGIKVAGSTIGRIKRREYQLFLIRVREMEQLKKKKKLFVKSRSNEDIRRIFERLYGSIYLEF